MILEVLTELETDQTGDTLVRRSKVDWRGSNLRALL